MKFKSKFYITIAIISIILIIALVLTNPLCNQENPNNGGVTAAPSLASPFQTLEIPILPTEIIERVPTEIIRVDVDIEDTEDRIQAILEAIENDEN